MSSGIKLDLTAHVLASKIAWSFWRHQQSIVTSSAERKPSEWDTGTVCENVIFIGIYEFVMSYKN